MSFDATSRIEYNTRGERTTCHKDQKHRDSVSGKVSHEASSFRVRYQPRGYRLGQKKNTILKDIEAEIDHRVIM